MIEIPVSPVAIHDETRRTAIVEGMMGRFLQEVGVRGQYIKQVVDRPRLARGKWWTFYNRGEESLGLLGAYTQ